VIFDVSLRGFRCVVRCVMVMTVRQLCVVRGGLVAAYGCVKTWAGLLGETQAQSLLEQTLNEEKTAARD
jgi:hypothetical protein